jgi:hypothetical protein
MKTIHANIHIWGEAQGIYKYKFETGGRIDVSPTVLVAMLRQAADDVEKEYNE